MEINAGQQYVQQANVPGQPEAVIQQLTNGLTGVPGYTITTTGPKSITLTRKFLPQWALIVAIVGALLCLIGLLALLVKEEEQLTVTATPGGSGTLLNITGVANGAMANRLSGVINNLGGQVGASLGVAPVAPVPPPPPGAPAPSTAAPAGAWHPDPSGRHEQRYYDGNAWTDHVMDGGTPGSDPAPQS